MKELSVFIDESGDFGKYSAHSPYYIITMVFHEQEQDITHEIKKLDYELHQLGLSNHCIHTGPIIRQEENYQYMQIKERRRIFNKLIAFVKQCNIKYKAFYIDKKHILGVEEAMDKLAKSIGVFIQQNYDKFIIYDCVKIYYDNGQVEVSRILSSVFRTLLVKVEIKKVMPLDYKLFQVADLFCTLELVRLKLEYNKLSKSEMLFFGNARDLKKNYLKPLGKKLFD